MLHAFGDPFLAVVEVLAGERIDAAQEGAAHDAADAGLPDEAAGEVGW